MSKVIVFPICGNLIRVYSRNFRKYWHVDKSISERCIKEYLFEKEISHVYKKELPYGASRKGEIHSNFFLLNYLEMGKGVYFGHWVYKGNNFQYFIAKKLIMAIYNKIMIFFVGAYEKTDIERINTILDRRLNNKNIIERTIIYED